MNPLANTLRSAYDLLSETREQMETAKPEELIGPISEVIGLLKAMYQMQEGEPEKTLADQMADKGTDQARETLEHLKREQAEKEAKLNAYARS